VWTSRDLAFVVVLVVVGFVYTTFVGQIAYTIKGISNWKRNLTN